ncbi:MAG: hypothetical protein MR355_03120 [Lachnospiraceae bacterium]|nr:hypothetical protein [Lachnospiraceae bacterium]
MTKKDFAHKLAEELRQLPTQSTIEEVVDRINAATIDHRSLSELDVNEILNYMDEELGDYGLLFESYDNQAGVSVMSLVRKLIAQANTGGGKK